MRKLIGITLVVLAAVFSLQWMEPVSPVDTWNEQTPVYEVLQFLGDAAPAHAMQTTPEQIKMGEELVKLGRTTKPGGGTSKYISLYNNCTHCHNIGREDPDLRLSNPETRLDYVIKNGGAFLQGTTFHGIVNRESWYNDDYVLKYGDLVKPANQSLREAIQLCARECSSGRYLEQWEEDAIVAYYWSLQLKMGELDLTADNWEQLKREAIDPNRHEFLRNGLKTFYKTKSPADFVDPPHDKAKGYDFTGNAENGQKIWEYGCLTCHREHGISQMVLDNSVMTARKFTRNFDKDKNWSLYEILRHGTHAKPGHRQYMPHYTLERMSHQQVEDLRAFLEQRAQG